MVNLLTTAAVLRLNGTKHVYTENVRGKCSPLEGVKGPGYAWTVCNVVSVYSWLDDHEGWKLEEAVREMEDDMQQMANLWATITSLFHYCYDGETFSCAVIYTSKTRGWCFWDDGSAMFYVNLIYFRMWKCILYNMKVLFKCCSYFSLKFNWKSKWKKKIYDSMFNRKICNSHMGRTTQPWDASEGLQWLKETKGVKTHYLLWFITL